MEESHHGDTPQKLWGGKNDLKLQLYNSPSRILRHFSGIHYHLKIYQWNDILWYTHKIEKHHQTSPTFSFKKLSPKINPNFERFTPTSPKILERLANLHQTPPLALGAFRLHVLLPVRQKQNRCRWRPRRLWWMLSTGACGETFFVVVAIIRSYNSSSDR